MSQHHSIIIVGAGAAGIGMAITLQDFNLSDVLILEKNSIGHSFKQWPKSTRTITPSFTTNGFGMPDINAVSIDTSPAFTFKEEHLSGSTYGEYLELISQHYQLNVETKTTVNSIEAKKDCYYIKTNHGDYSADYLFIATGDFDFPYQPFQYGRHYSKIHDFNTLGQDNKRYTIIGGNESAFDAAIHLSNVGAQVSIYAQQSSFNQVDADPSIRLSSYTYHRLKSAMSNGAQIDMHTPYTLASISYDNDIYTLTFTNGLITQSETEPIIATGFDVRANPLVQQLFDINGQDIKLTDQDESTRYPNVFMIGATVRHDNATLCYIYKFRARFAVLAKIIADREGLSGNQNIVDRYKHNQMYLDDYECCDVNCSC